MTKKAFFERNSIKINLVLPLASIFLVFFSLFILFFLLKDQSKKISDFHEMKTRTVEMIATTNSANLLNKDRPAMGVNLDSFMKNKEIVSIDLLDRNGMSVKKVMKPAKGGVTSERRDIIYNNVRLGSAVVEYTDRYIVEDIGSMAAIFILMATVLIVVMASAFILFTAFITAPIASLTAQAVRVAVGEAGATVSVKKARSREVALLASAVEQMTAELGNRADGFRRTNEILSEIIRKAKDIVVNLNSGTKQIESSAQEQTTAMNEFASGITEVSATLEELTITARQITGNVGELVLSSGEAIKRLQANEGRLLETASRLAGVGEVSRKNAREIGELGKRSVLIGEMVELIKEVANKTNILSINASIEASRSGESGSGFAVVAAEIRELSKETVASAKSVEKAAREIEAFIGSLVQSSESEAATVVESGGIVKSIHDELGSVAEKIGGNYSFTQKIDVSIKQQENGSKQAADTMRQMAEISRQSTGGARETLQVVKDIVAMAENLSETIAKFGREENSPPA
ncbi:MAG: hypothetical protein JXD23_11915 [Spirochaetales bacterium]|nr:hypothetical protein [Spirochaetales bacterium]